MASIKRHHETDCAGGTCLCPWRLDYRPEGMSGARRRLRIPNSQDRRNDTYTDTSSKCRAANTSRPPTFPLFGGRRPGMDRRQSRPARHWPPSRHAGRRRGMLRHLAPLDDLRLDRIDVAMIESSATTSVSARTKLRGV